MNGYMNCCVYLIHMHNIVYYQSNMTCLTVLIMNLQIPKYLTFYVFKISKLPTVKSQYELEGIVIKLLPGINQSKDKITSNSISFHASFSGIMGTHWFNFLNKLLMIYDSVFRHLLQAKYKWFSELLCVFDIIYA